MDVAADKAAVLLETWRMRVKRHQLAHRFAAKGYGALHLRMGVPAIGLSSFVGAFVFASYEAGLSDYVKLSVGLASVAAAILTALQTFLRFDELSNKHQRADAGFGEIRHRIEHRQALNLPGDNNQREFFSGLESALSKLANESPVVPERFWQKARRAMQTEVRR